MKEISKYIAEYRRNGPIDNSFHYTLNKKFILLQYYANSVYVHLYRQTIVYLFVHLQR